MSNIPGAINPMYEEDVGHKHPVSENTLQKIGQNENFFKDAQEARQSEDDSLAASMGEWLARNIRLRADYQATVSLAVAWGFAGLEYYTVFNTLGALPASNTCALGTFNQANDFIFFKGAAPYGVTPVESIPLEFCGVNADQQIGVDVYDVVRI